MRDCAGEGKARDRAGAEQGKTPVFQAAELRLILVQKLLLDGGTVFSVPAPELAERLPGRQQQPGRLHGQSRCDRRFQPALPQRLQPVIHQEQRISPSRSGAADQAASLVRTEHAAVAFAQIARSDCAGGIQAEQQRVPPRTGRAIEAFP